LTASEPRTPNARKARNKELRTKNRFARTKNAPQAQRARRAHNVDRQELTPLLCSRRRSFLSAESLNEERRTPNAPQALQPRTTNPEPGTASPQPRTRNHERRTRAQRAPLSTFSF
jgi:hypothetical protein